MQINLVFVTFFYLNYYDIGEKRSWLARGRSLPPATRQCVRYQNSSRTRQNEEDYPIVRLEVRSYINSGKHSKALSNRKTSSKLPTPSPQEQIRSPSPQRPLLSISIRRKVALLFYPRLHYPENRKRRAHRRNHQERYHFRLGYQKHP